MSWKTITDRLRFQFWRLRDALRDRLQGRAHRQKVFENIYSHNLWGDPESVSGSGSGTEATSGVRKELGRLFDAFNVRSLVDAPCGDFFWIKEIAASLDSYVGVDIVPELVEKNRRSFGSESISFLCADISADALPKADLIMCRDCFIHLPSRMIVAALANFRASGARYLLLTSDVGADAYRDIPIGSFRSVDFQRPPFSFPTPLASFSDGADDRRRLCLWELKSLPTSI